MNIKEEFPSETELEKLYKLNKRHITELIFFDDEVRFLKGLINKYFMHELKHEHINKSQMIHDRLSQLALIKSNVSRDALLHQENLHVKIKDINNHDFYFFKLESNRIVEEMKDLNRNFKHIKKEIFHISKEIIGFESDVSK
ncbi:hypothetical protein A5893_04745 [Pedobacter psychrophilus]|uniref:Uncharacterized protein n=1 Tax=Pedobacter psychrophilus TaxID=1826909 RepID=A0A179DGS0_9SPHI|nr:hypothetical protein [Pedobacter psychrophilus]OAQ40265.1 hypothetical protein A5893_04745 [Pedobacter psychrophilus]